MSLKFRQSGLLYKLMRFSFEKGSLELLNTSSLGVDNSEMGSMVWLTVLILEVRRHQFSSQLTIRYAYDLSFKSYSSTVVFPAS